MGYLYNLKEKIKVQTLSQQPRKFSALALFKIGSIILSIYRSLSRKMKMEK